MSELPSRTGSGPRLAVVTPWYPCAQRPFSGAFVRAATDAVAASGSIGEVQVVHGEDWPGPRGAFRFDLARTAHTRLAGSPDRRVRIPVGGRDLGPSGRPGQSLLRVPVPVRPGGEYADWALAHEAALRAALPGGVIDADVVHGHVGTYGGWAAVRLARPGARVVVTEHASFLPRILGQKRAREMYREVLERADAVVCVSGMLRDRLIDRFPWARDRIRVVPNVVDVGSLAPRSARPKALHRWLYLGNLAPSKGIPELIEAFAQVAAEEPEVTLTLVGSGAPAFVDGVRERAAGLGVAERLELLGPVPPDAVPGLLREHDLLVHPSKLETFGMTTAEAVAVGTPVLVTRCGGPEQTLAGLDGVAGRLIDVSDDPAVIADGYRALAEGIDGLDPARGREVLARRYGERAVVGGLLDAYGIDGAAAAGPVRRPAAPVRRPSAGRLPRRVVVVAAGGNRGRAVAEETAALVERGITVELYAADEAALQRDGLDPRVRVRVVGPLGGAHALRAARLLRLTARAIGTGEGVEVVLADAHAFALAWQLARRCPRARLRIAPEALGNGWTPAAGTATATDLDTDAEGGTAMTAGSVDGTADATAGGGAEAPGRADAEEALAADGAVS